MNYKVEFKWQYFPWQTNYFTDEEDAIAFAKTVQKTFGNKGGFICHVSESKYEARLYLAGTDIIREGE